MSNVDRYLRVGSLSLSLCILFLSRSLAFLPSGEEFTRLEKKRVAVVVGVVMVTALSRCNIYVCSLFICLSPASCFFRSSTGGDRGDLAEIEICLDKKTQPKHRNARKNTSTRRGGRGKRKKIEKQKRQLAQRNPSRVDCAPRSSPRNNVRPSRRQI